MKQIYYKFLEKLKNKVSLGSLFQIIIHPISILKLPWYLSQLITYRKKEVEIFGSFSSLRLYPCLSDVKETQIINNFYFYQDCWAARQLFNEKPPYFVDVGSSVTFVGITSQAIPCVSVDIRPIEIKLDYLTIKAGSILDMPFADNELPCITSMCVLEHIGLGRYGDELDPEGTNKAVREIDRVLAPGGMVIYSLPIGRKITEFNAHRRFLYDEAKNLFPDYLLIDSCVLAPSFIMIASEDDIYNLYDPIACFCLRKPNVEAG